MRIFTVDSGKVSKGAHVGKLALKGAGVTIPAIFVGEEGRGRELGVMPVQLLPDQQKQWTENGYVTVEYGEIGLTKAGKYKLFTKPEPGMEDLVVLVMTTMIGFRGSNGHTGDHILVPCPARGENHVHSYSGKCEECNCDLTPIGDDNNHFIHPDNGDVINYEKFPGDILVTGTIAEGEAGRAGSGTQLICTMPKDIVFRTTYGGRLYGSPSAHYYVWNGVRVLSATSEERSVAELF